MADATSPVAYGTTIPPVGNISLAKLPDAIPPSPSDMVWASQFIAAEGRYRSRRMTFAQVQTHARPACVYVNADHAATPTEVGFYLDASGGDFTLTLPSIGDVGGLEIAILNVGTAGTATVAGQAADSLVGPAGLLPSLAFRPGETARLRAVVVPSPARSGWYLVGV